jgi:hypothetical protein
MVKEGMEDPRFARMHTDPRFQRFPKKKGQVEIDSRFAGARPLLVCAALLLRAAAAAARLTAALRACRLLCSKQSAWGVNFELAFKGAAGTA